MTIVEELDKMSGRPHRSKNIVDAMKYAFNIEKTPQNISEAVKGINGAGGGSIKSVTIQHDSSSSANVSVYFSDGTSTTPGQTHDVNWIVGSSIYLEAESGFYVNIPRDEDKYSVDYRFINNQSKVFISPKTEDVDTITISTEASGD